MENMLMVLQLLCYLWFIIPLTSAQGVGGSCDANSCYIITRSGNTWDENQQSCKDKGGDLVSMETLKEWEFINNEIQQITLPRVNEWHIGLMKNGENWKWVNGKPMTIKKWQSYEPNGDGNVVVMSKDYPPGSQGLFNDLPPSYRKPYICEIPRGNRKQPAPPMSPSGNPAPAAGGQQGVCNHDQLFDFEVANQENCFLRDPKSSANTVKLSIEKATVKHGTKSLKWHATGAAAKLKLKFAAPFANDWMKRGGVKVWFYKKTSSSGKTLKVEYKRSGNAVGGFQANLNFEGWRGIWVTFHECRLTKTSLSTSIDEVNFELSGADTIYMDLLEFPKSVGKQSRDKVVPPISPFGLNLYDASNTWQQTYRWSQQAVPPLPSTIDLTKKRSLALIGSRLKNWYCDETKTSPNFQSGSFLEKRWNSLLGHVKTAHEEYDKLDIVGGKVIGPPLFCRDCRYPRKFELIMETILLPLSLEYYLRSRTNEISDLAADQLSALNSGDSTEKDKAYQAIAGDHQPMQTLFQGHLPKSRVLTSTDLKDAINKLNTDRLKRINNLLDYVKQQGFADGSGLGSLDHEMNKDGAGFMHTLFLISDTLSKPRLLDLIKTAKWYNDFREIYQSPAFEIKGTTADRMITLMLFRLMLVLVMPSDNDDEVKAKIRDMDALVRWMNNALDVNEGLGGVFKPDFVGHHHKAFYGSAYVPQALHTAAFVQYLLDGTEFALLPSSVNRIRRGLETLRLIAVKYSTPNSVNGRFPTYTNEVILKAVLPAYAYISVSHPCNTGIRVTCVNKPEMFLRLYNDNSVNKYLEDAKIKNKHFYNSLGSLDIMEAVKSIAQSKGISPESSPEGHWSKNFAVLSIHRRKDWAVTAKGFNRFLWDFENSAKENIYGMFASHGALLIANSEASLKVHDVENGWDWAKVPGATTIALGSSNIDDLKMVKGRFYNRKRLAGGLTFKGTSTLENGIFAMNFKQPTYGLKRTDWRRNIDFEFKKSVFFFENLLVCLGSNIKASNTGGKVVQTTLFQGKLKPGSRTLPIKINGVQKTSPRPVNIPSTPRYTTLTDTQRNFYYIPNLSKPMLKVHIQDQNSKNDDGSKDTSAIYGTAWFEHGSSPSSSNYEYAVLIPTASYVASPTNIATAQESSASKAYEVLQKDGTAHVVKFLKSPKSWSALNHPIYGYVMFEKSNSLNAPLKEVNKGNCIIMAEETTEFIYLSITSPGLNLLRSSVNLRNSGDVGENELYHSSSRENKIEVTLRKKVQQRIVSIQTHGNPDSYEPNVRIDDQGLKVTFFNLKNGFSVEVQLKK